jgi:DNA repair protein RecO (recombination protein O)
MRQSLEPAYLLHARPYRNTSVLADFFTLQHGRVNGVVRGARGANSKLRGIVQPFLPLEISWVGKGELVTVSKIEPARTLGAIAGAAISYGFYINELLVRLLRVREAHADLYAAYETILQDLITGNVTEVSLRIFEKHLLQELGYGLQLTHEYDTGEPTVPDLWYSFFPDRGAQRIALQTEPPEWAFSGASLLALDKEEWSDAAVLRDAKRLMRQALGRVLGDKPLKSRELFL